MKSRKLFLALSGSLLFALGVATGLTCKVPDDYLLQNRRPLLFGRELLKAVMAEFNHRDMRC